MKTCCAGCYVIPTISNPHRRGHGGNGRKMSTEYEQKLITDLARIGCERVNPENPLRVAVSVGYLVDLLLAVERYLPRFDEAMIGAGKAKKEGLDTSGTVKKIQELQTELGMYATLARLKLGPTATE